MPEVTYVSGTPTECHGLLSAVGHYSSVERIMRKQMTIPYLFLGALHTGCRDGAHSQKFTEQCLGEGQKSTK